MTIKCCNESKWHTHKLGELFELTYGSSLPKRTRIDGSVPVFGSNGCVGFHSQAITQGQTIIVGRKGSVGEVTWSDISCFPIDTTYYIDKLKMPSSLKYIFFGLKYLDMPSLQKSSAIPGLDREDVYKLNLLFPPSVEEQIAIVSAIEIKLRNFEQMQEAARHQLEAISALPAATLREFFHFGGCSNA